MTQTNDCNHPSSSKKKKYCSDYGCPLCTVCCASTTTLKKHLKQKHCLSETEAAKYVEDPFHADSDSNDSDDASENNFADSENSAPPSPDQEGLGLIQEGNDVPAALARELEKADDYVDDVEPSAQTYTR